MVDAATGFGDGVFEAITLGIGDLGEIRDAFGIDGGMNECSGLYNGAGLAGNVVGGAALGGALANKAFSPGGWAKSNRYLRVGWGKHDGH